jgi:neutral trehalase
MYANAVAISKIARMNGDLVTATEFEQKANAIRAGILSLLWDNERSFFYHVWR